jgi:putative SOS response-associated peptidase YedK
MCGRYSLYHPEEMLSEHFQVPFPTLSPRYNLAPTQNIAFIFQNAEEARQAGRARWGLIPHWSKQGDTRSPLFNARSETVLEKPAFKQAFIRGRCLVPASGWFEWLRLEDRKQPYHLKLKTNEPIAFAGLFDVWRDQENKKRMVSVTILTTAASEDLAWLHDRMPVILSFDDYDLWLDRSTPDIADLTELLQPLAAEELEVYEVDHGMNDAREDKPEFVAPRPALPPSSWINQGEA